MKKFLLLLLCFFLFLMCIFADDDEESAEGGVRSAELTENLEKEVDVKDEIESVDVEKTSDNEDESESVELGEKVDSEEEDNYDLRPTNSALEEEELPPPTMNEMLLAYSVFTATDDELKKMAESYGITSNYKEELLKVYGIKRTEGEVIAFFKSKDEKEKSEYNFKVNKAERFEKLQSDGDDNEHPLALYGGVNVSFSKGEEAKTLTSDAMVISNKDKILIAYGDIGISDTKGSTLQDISSSLLVFDFDKNKLSLYDAVGSTDKKSGERTIPYYMNGKNITFDNRTSETYFKNAVLSTNKNKNQARWSINSDEILMKGTGDIFLTLMYLKVGRVPIMGLPALFMPGTSLTFNPALGFNSDKGAFVNTTIDIFGGFKDTAGTQDADLASSFTSLFASDTNKDTVQKDGLIYVKDNNREQSALEKWAKESESHLTFFLDTYTNEGIFLGGDTELNFVDKKISISLLGGGAYKPQQKVTYYSSNTYPSWRYGLYAKAKFNLSFLSLDLEAPYVSDPQFKHKYLNRITKFSFDSLLGSKQTFPTTYSSSDESTLNDTLKLTFTLPSKATSQYLSTLSITVNAKIQQSWKAPYSRSSNDPYSFKNGEAELPAINMSFGGTLIDVKSGSTATKKETIEYSYDKALEMQNKLLSLPLQERLESELLIQRAREKAIKDLEEETDLSKYIVLDEIGLKDDSEKILGKLPDGFQEATASLSKNKISALSFFDNSYLKFTYSVSEEFSNTYLAPEDKDHFLGDGTIYSKTSGSFALSGAINQKYFTFSEKITPEYIYSKQENLDNLESHEFSLVGTTAVSVPIIGLSWNLGMTYYRYKKSSSDSSTTTIEEGGGKWTKDDISTHNISLSKSFFNGIFGFSISGNLPPLSSTISPTVRFAYKGFSLSASHSMNGDDFTKLKNKTTQGTFGYTNSFMNAGLAVSYDYTKEIVGMKALRPFEIAENMSFTFFNSLLKINQNITFQGVSSSGIENYFQAMNLSVSLGQWASVTLGVDGEASDLKFSTSRLSVSTGDILWKLWRGRIQIGFNISGTMNFDFNDPFQNYLDYSFALRLEIKEFLSASIALKGSNKNFYRYFGGGTGTGAFEADEFFKDLLRGINIFNPDGLKHTNFVLSGLDISVSHDMGDWSLSFTYTTEIVLEKNEWTWKPKYTILLQWSAIPELKVDRTIDK